MKAVKPHGRNTSIVETTEGHAYVDSDCLPARVTVGRTLEENPSIELKSSTILRGTTHWEVLSIVDLDPRAARHLAYALLSAANSCEP